MYTFLGLLTITCLGLVAILFDHWKRSKKTYKTLDHLANISFDLTGSAEQVSSVSRDLRNASLEQLDILNTTSSTSHEINAMMNRTQENTDSLSSESNHLKNTAYI